MAGMSMGASEGPEGCRGLGAAKPGHGQVPGYLAEAAGGRLGNAGTSLAGSVGGHGCCAAQPRPLPVSRCRPNPRCWAIIARLVAEACTPGTSHPAQIIVETLTR